MKGSLEKNVTLLRVYTGGMNPQPEPPLLLFFDGACPVCAREVSGYLRRDGGHHLQGVDISSADFDPARWGRSGAEFDARMHALDAAGRWYLGVDAFVAIWQLLPGRHWSWAARLLKVAPVRWLAQAGYHVFARHRHLLKRRQCDTACNKNNTPA